MNNKIITATITIFTIFLMNTFAFDFPQQKENNQDKSKETVVKQKENQNKAKTKTVVEKDIKTDKNASKDKEVVSTKADTIKKLKLEVKDSDTLKVVENLKFKSFKKQAHASYYHDRFNGRRTASGAKFDNSKYTAAHKKLSFGTVVRVTNEANGKSVIVQITDRGPFVKTRDIDLSRKAFMEIVSNKNSGSVIVTIEVIDK
jgi:rare lipoprotein A